MERGVGVMWLNRSPRARGAAETCTCGQRQPPPLVGQGPQGRSGLWNRGGEELRVAGECLPVSPGRAGVRACLKVVTVFLVTRGDCLVPSLPRRYADRMTSLAPTFPLLALHV